MKLIMNHSTIMMASVAAVIVVTCKSDFIRISTRSILCAIQMRDPVFMNEWMNEWRFVQIVCIVLIRSELKRHVWAISAPELLKIAESWA